MVSTNCDVCGKSLVDQNGERLVVGIRVRCETTKPGCTCTGCAEEAMRTAVHLQENITPYQLNRDYNVCFACLLRALGVKPEGPDPKATGCMMQMACRFGDVCQLRWAAKTTRCERFAKKGD